MEIYNNDLAPIKDLQKLLANVAVLRQHGQQLLSDKPVHPHDREKIV